MDAIVTRDILFYEFFPEAPKKEGMEVYLAAGDIVTLVDDQPAMRAYYQVADQNQVAVHIDFDPDTVYWMSARDLEPQITLYLNAASGQALLELLESGPLFEPLKTVLSQLIGNLRHLDKARHETKGL